MVVLGWCRKSFYQYGVQGVECSNHSVPTKKLQQKSLVSNDQAFLFFGVCGCASIVSALLGSCRVALVA